jgi:hypothetical protein
MMNLICVDIAAQWPIGSWRGVADRLGIGRPEMERMASAFEHDDLRRATDG